MKMIIVMTKSGPCCINAALINCVEGTDEGKANPGISFNFNRLKGTVGEAVNAIQSAAAMNFKKLQCLS